MSLMSLSLKKAYSSDFDDILCDFYIPALSKSVEYWRLAGFFSSTSLAIAARGILGLIKNGGIMKVIFCPALTKEELEVMLEAKQQPEKYLETKMLKELDNLDNLESEFVRDHLFALGWMIANNKLDVKVAVVYNESGFPMRYDEILASGIFHQKVGILRDNVGNVITFSGSVNETAAGWLGNVEEIKIFRSWVSEEEAYVRADLEKFKRFWENSSPRVKVMAIPDAVREKLISMAPKDINDINLERWYAKRKKMKVELYQYQKDAISAWLKNGTCGIFEMATGTGKTFTALGCVNRIFGMLPKVLLIITCPYNHLVQQWKNEVDNFNLEYDKMILALGGYKWKNNLADSLKDLTLGYINKLIVLTTHATFSSHDFIRIVQENKENFQAFLVADEVHWLGAKKNKRGLINEYDFRLGLSATPKRWFDDVGTEEIYKYFKGVVYEFSLREAIIKVNPATGNTYLVPYKYLPKFVSLTEDELEQYFHVTRSIAKKFYITKDEKEKDKILENLLFKRADIVKNAKEKYDALRKILDERKNNVEYTIIYSTPQQIDEVMRIVNEKGLTVHRFTMEEGTLPKSKYKGLSEREFILQKFAEREYQVLVAMKCLDEGVDVPPARTAIFMASSGNPREYIQRIGRVIRRYPGKTEAVIYDIIVIPSLNKSIPLDFKELELKIFEKELRRYEELAQIARNNAEVLELIYNIRAKLMN